MEKERHNIAYQHIYLSPHYDDASLSCGGAIYQQTQAGQPVLVITICAATPPSTAPLSPFAQILHEAWGDSEHMVAARQAEDRISMDILGCDYQRLDFTDCIYRGDFQKLRWYYTGDADIFGEIHPADLALTHQIAAAITALVAPAKDALIYAPLTVGHHVDHQLTYATAGRLRQAGWRVVFYEDYPYVDPGYPFTRSPLGHDRAYDLATTLASLPAVALQPRLQLLSEPALQVKVESIRAYASQLQVLFGGAAAMENVVRAYARQVGDGRLAERIWTPT